MGAPLIERVGAIIARELSLEDPESYVLRFPEDQCELGFTYVPSEKCGGPYHFSLSTSFKFIQEKDTYRREGAEDVFCDNPEAVPLPEKERQDFVRSALYLAGYPIDCSGAAGACAKGPEIEALAKKIRDADARSIEEGDRIRVRVKGRSIRSLSGKIFMIEPKYYALLLDEDWTGPDGKKVKKGALMHVFREGRDHFISAVGNSKKWYVTIKEIPKPSR